MLKRKLTNFDLLFLVLLALTLVGITWLANRDAVRPLIVFGIVAVTVLVLSLAGAVVQAVFLKDKDSVWIRPVSSTIGVTIGNIVVVSWLCVVCAIMLLFVRKSSPNTGASAIALLLLVGIGSGWWLRTKFSKFSLLPYGISFTLALLVVMAVVIGFGLK